MSRTPESGRAAVIGGAGFIGRHLVGRLAAQGSTVRVVGINQPGPGAGADWRRCDVRDAARLQAALDGVEVVYNLAAAHGLEGISPAEFRDVNVAGARSVCQAATAAGARRIVFTSSAAVYGRGGFPGESAPPNPSGSYAVTKLAAEEEYRAWAAAAPHRSLMIVRPTVVFGPGGEGTGGRLLRHLAGPHFAQVGPARNRKSLAYVENLAAFLAFLCNTPTGVEVYNYADAPDLELHEIAAIVRSAVGLPAAPRHSAARVLAGNVGRAIADALANRPTQSIRSTSITLQRLARDMRYDASKAHRSGFRQPVPLREALDATARVDASWVALLSRARA